MAQTAFTAARSEVEKAMEKQPDFPEALSLLGMINAGLGRKEEALRQGRRACELVPITKDAMDGVNFAINLAQIYAWTGEKDLAINRSKWFSGFRTLSATAYSNSIPTGTRSAVIRASKKS